MLEHSTLPKKKKSKQISIIRKVLKDKLYCSVRRDSTRKAFTTQQLWE